MAAAMARSRQTAAPLMRDDERRLAPRLRPDDVPWIREVKPICGGSALLLNISLTGVLLETTTRLLPGRRTTVVIVNDADQKVRAEGHVIRSELVTIGKAGELIYQTAVAFREQLPAETRRALRFEPEGITSSALSEPQLVELGTLLEHDDDHVLIEWRAPADALHASGW
jgi:hypothetical protein